MRARKHAINNGRASDAPALIGKLQAKTQMVAGQGPAMAEQDISSASKPFQRFQANHILGLDQLGLTKGMGYPGSREERVKPHHGVPLLIHSEAGRLQPRHTMPE
ncbi:hypothetical protein Nwi_1022 [Nitrobacter winogradskyi Nb-255]|uniref:Uncharacterized protein n=1 Tax=Nitrobacter winogradskyi (strain ATCC 25391 / DSM 10237 / CIP 104748 / NCIMB 11846 / Nb-255) TaxID=323098 RepID=Q3STV7_NITWN|nr:hypothetical protein Nwi_1022 [Nitrobacter winogradskyi Nb-255]